MDRQRSPQRYDDHLCCLLRQHDADRAGHDGGQSGLPVERPDREIASRLERVALAPLLAGAAFLGVLLVTAPHGPGLVPDDSLAYLGTATLLAHGEGLRLPAAQWWSADSTATLVRYPPGMAVALALPIAAGLTPTTAARLVLAACAAGTVVMTWLLVAGIAGPGAAAFAAVAVMATPAVAQVHVAVWSEPLFLVLLSLLLLELVRVPDRATLIGVTVAASVIVRYAGLALAFAVFAWTLARPGTARARLRAATRAVLPTAVVLGVWWLWTRGAGQPVRAVGLFGRGLRTELTDAWRTTVQWLVPAGIIRGATRALVAFAMLAAIALLVLATLRRLRRARDGELGDPAAAAEARLYLAAGLIVPCYALTLILSRVFADPRIPFNDRTLMPAFLVVELATAVALARWIERGKIRFARRLLLLPVIGWIVLSGLVTAVRCSNAMHTGVFFGEQRWHESGLMAWLRAHGGSYALYSNQPTPVWFYAHRPARYLPAKADPDTLRALDSVFVARHGALVAVAVAAPWELPIQSVIDALHLVPVAAFPEGSVWVPRQPPARPRGGA